jgi:hypothetical protein
MECLNLIVQYVNDPRPGRQAEYEECLRRNLANPFVKSVHHLREHPGVVVPAEFAGHPKFREQHLNRWLSFADAFEYASATLPGEICCIANLDIFLDAAPVWLELAEIFKDPIVFCLSRHEFNADGTIWIDPISQNRGMANSQDAWVFLSPVKIQNCDFGVGVMGCDNAIAHRIKQSGLVPVNAARHFRIFHFDRVRGKTMENQEDIYASERSQSRPRQHPERLGQYLLPDIDTLTSVDDLLTSLNANRMDRYRAICDTLNNLRHLKNGVDGPIAPAGGKNL